MTFPEHRPKSNGKVCLLPTGLYADWRARFGAAQVLAEPVSSLPLREDLLRLIWQFQRLQRDQLHTTDGRPLKVLHPGFWNSEAGPDFKAAALQFGSDPVRSGDIEVDLLPQGWLAHRHAQNPAYAQVILHVVWDSDSSPPSPLPTLTLKSRLDAPLEDLELWLRQDPREERACVLGQCSRPLMQLPQDTLGALLDQAAQIRLQTKAGQLHARARQAGWEQALWEGLFTALGYKQNTWPMQRISELLPTIRQAGGRPGSCLELQARLLGISGLLPSGVEAGPESAAYLRRLWDVWWREREEFGELCLPRSLWRLHGLRPANSPHRRLALAAHWLAEPHLAASLERWFESARPDSPLRASLLEVLQGTQDPFWSRHWTLQSGRTRSPQPLLGANRVTDLAMNVVLPWFWVRAGAGKNQPLQERAERCYFAWPKAQDNAVLRLARRRLFGTGQAGLVRTAARQQGLLQIVRDFCEHFNALCQNCPLPQFLTTTCGP